MERPASDPFDVVTLTLDVDWVAEEILEEVVSRLTEQGLPATFFATHESEVLASLDREQFEVALHPNFERSTEDLNRPLRELKSLYPEAIGARSHSLFTSSRILALYSEHGLGYEANIFLLGHPHLRPTLRYEGLVSIPFIWSDDKHLDLGLPFEASSLPLDQPGLKVLNFHPIHLAMNTRDPGHYDSYRAQIDDPRALRALANTGAPGISDLFAVMAEELGRLGLTVVQMREIHERFARDPSSRAELGSRS